METNLRFLLKFRSCPSVLLLSTLGRKSLSDGNRAIGLVPWASKSEEGGQADGVLGMGTCGSPEND